MNYEPNQAEISVRNYSRLIWNRFHITLILIMNQCWFTCTSYQCIIHLHNSVSYCEKDFQSYTYSMCTHLQTLFYIIILLHTQKPIRKKNSVKLTYHILRHTQVCVIISCFFVIKYCHFFPWFLQRTFYF